MGRMDGEWLKSVFFDFANKMKDGELGWGGVGVALKRIANKSQVIQFVFCVKTW
jgi:hypothetical protein